MKAVPSEATRALEEAGISVAPATEVVSLAPAAGARSEGSTNDAELAQLKADLTRIKSAIRRKIHVQLDHEGKKTSTVNAFTEKTMATIAAWFTAQTFFAFITELVMGEDSKSGYRKLIARAIYVVVITIIVPLAGWALRGKALEPTTWKGDQVQLIKACLPMLLAWAWKDMVADSISIIEFTFWPEVLFAATLTAAVAFTEAMPCYHRANRAVKEKGSGDTPLARFAIVPGKLGLAVGFAWNSVASWPVKQAATEMKARLLDMILQCVYYVVVTAIITYATMKWSERQDKKEKEEGPSDAEKPKDPKAEDEFFEVMSVAQYIQELETLAASVSLNALHFVYGWAMLDTVNMFFFSYLMHCDGPKQCSYQSNFAFAIAITVMFTWLVGVFKVQARRSAWSKAATSLMSNSMALNVGWAWMNYCATAIKYAQTSQMVSDLWMYLICSAFAWCLMSFAHHKFAIEKRAWDRQSREDAVAHGISFM